MDAAEYKRICCRPDVLPRSSVEATHRLLSNVDAVLAAKVRNILALEPIPKPPKHDAGAHSDYLQVSMLPDRDMEAVVDALSHLEASAILSDNVRVTYVADLVDTWTRAIQGEGS